MRSTPEFHLEGTYHPKLALIQLAIPDRIAVIDATVVDVGHLEPLVAGPGVAVIHGGGPDLEILSRACGVRPSRVFDTQVAAGFLGYGLASLGRVVGEVLGRGMDKSLQMSDWFRRPLSAEQLAYPEADVAICSSSASCSKPAWPTSGASSGPSRSAIVSAPPAPSTTRPLGGACRVALTVASM